MRKNEGECRQNIGYPHTAKAHQDHNIKVFKPKAKFYKQRGYSYANQGFYTVDHKPNQGFHANDLHNGIRFDHQVFKVPSLTSERVQAIVVATPTVAQHKEEGFRQNIKICGKPLL